MGSRPRFYSVLHGPYQGTCQEKARRGPNPPRVITQEEESGRKRNVLIHCPTHPLPLISLPEFYSPLLQGRGWRGRAPVPLQLRDLSRLAIQLVQQGPRGRHAQTRGGWTVGLSSLATAPAGGGRGGTVNTGRGRPRRLKQPPHPRVELGSISCILAWAWGHPERHCLPAGF